mmetsp:Transcript_148389/g.413436  ORF Transcript_148389/g.413436 Transcript_148389/m.413436 type:complete len:309 (-) Transcript_148389:357-1283(-)|eukprot:CAMPEP_0179026430 /NCGR_PEP_ID=MMETSP0796-20121207/8509_1 /TAXON_ID=73915 /ORGANISM="Pyrodinium bahamense, Strain pbaha01" /LENGTH=308 /DNA_ID=CAMNT_0020722507 /DNA_START=82 /DNA_END=1008 /DNA_ORIENTATION=+
MPSSCGMLIVLAASATGVGRGQFLRPVVLKSFSSSFVSSSSWVSGSDGQLHQQMHEVRTETLHSNVGAMKSTHSEVSCEDGLCKQRVSVARPGSLTVVEGTAPRAADWAESAWVPLRLRAILRSLVGPRAGGGEGAPLPHKFLAPRPLPAEAAPRAKDGALESLAKNLALSGAGLALVALLVGILRCKQVDSRELPLRSLGEPLAPAQQPASAGGAMPPPPVVVAAAAMAFPAAEAIAAEHAKAALEAAPRAYLLRVYARASPPPQTVEATVVATEESNVDVVVKDYLLDLYARVGAQALLEAAAHCP